jgi:HlyD family secretion protein
MYAIAQVYQSDIQKVKPNQRVKILSDSINGELLGKVERIDSQVKRQTIVNSDPSTNIDGRVVEVHVALDRDSSKRAAKFTNLQVTMEIEQ